MPKIKSFPDLLKILAALFITSLAISNIISIPGRKGVVTMLVPPSVAEAFYNIFGTAILAISYVIYFALFFLIPVAIWSYCRNRRKPSGDWAISVAERQENTNLKEALKETLTATGLTGEGLKKAFKDALKEIEDEKSQKKHPPAS